MDEMKNNFFYKIYYSIAGFRYYKFFPMQKTGKAVVYLLLLTLLLGAASLVMPIFVFNTAIDEMTLKYDEEVPEFSFSNGELQVEGKMPIFINGGTMTMIIDTTSDDDSVLDNYDAAILISKTRMIQKTYEKKQITNFSMLPGLSTNKAAVKNMLPLLKWLSIFIAVFGLIFFVIGKFISALIIASIGMIISRIMGLTLVFRDLFVLSAYAMTLPLILGTLLGFLPMAISFLWMPFYIIAGVYLAGALSVIKKDIFVQQ